MGIRRSFNTNVRLWMALGPALFLFLLGIGVGIAAWMGYPRPGETFPVVVASGLILAGALVLGRWWQMFRNQRSAGGYRRKRSHR